MWGVLQTFRSGLEERIKSPFWSAFLVSWLIINYRFLLIIISDERVARKFSLIDDLYVSKVDAAVYIFFPVIPALLYVMIWPRLDKFIFSIWAKLQLALIEKKIEIDNETPIRGEAARALRRKHTEIEEEYDARILKMENEKGGLLSKMESLEKELSSEKDKLRSWFNMGERLSTDSEIKKALLNFRYRIYFNPENEVSGSKLISFIEGGDIAEGKSAEEHSWGVRNNCLEIRNKNEKINSRFYYFVHKRIFLTSPDNETETSYQQYMVVEQEEF